MHTNSKQHVFLIAILFLQVSNAVAHDQQDVKSAELAVQSTIFEESNEQQEKCFAERMQESFVQGVETSVKLVVPTVVVTSIIMIMLYQPYQSLHASIVESTKSFEGMKDSFAKISQSFNQIKGSMEGSKAAFQHIDESFKKFLKMFDDRESWAGYLFGGRSSTL